MDSVCIVVISELRVLQLYCLQRRAFFELGLLFGVRMVFKMLLLLIAREQPMICLGNLHFSIFERLALQPIALNSIVVPLRANAGCFVLLDAHVVGERLIHNDLLASDN